MKSIAIVYINSHHEDLRYVKEANASARSFKKYLPDAKYYLYTDADYSEDAMGEFDEVRQREFYILDFMENRVHLNGQMLVKHQALLEMEEDYVLYVGADTYALKSEVSQLPLLLERFELLVAHAPVRINTEIGNSSIPEVPVGFPELNCDLIFFRNTEKVKSFMRKWQEGYRSDLLSHTHDQGTFRYFLFQSDLDFYILPPEYNYRGHEYRDDTIILQNRFQLSKYLKDKNKSQFGAFSELLAKLKVVGSK